jgi:tryptophanyl-tRNA synthetase
MYNNEYFPEPVAFNFGENLVKIPGLDGGGKMGKSEGEGNAIFLADPPEVIRKKVMRAVTDAGPTAKNQEKPEAIENLFQLMKVVSSPDTVSFFDDQYNNCTIRYGDLKKQLAEDMVNFTAPFREKILELSADDAYLHKVARLGCDKARESAAKTISDVRHIIGFREF